MQTVDYGATAELYPSKRFNRARQLRYRRFDSVAEALQYAIEEMPEEFLHGALLEVDEERYEGTEIRALYDNVAYPLPRGPIRGKREADK